MDLVDSFGRVVRDLRISVTDRCNFRCTYCMPAEGMTWLDRAEVLTYEEIERVARICVEKFGVDSLRLTGGEPTVRAHLPQLISKLAALRLPDGTKPDIALTTNGATLRNIAVELRDAGLDRINVSMDSLKPERFFAMTRRDELHNVLAGIAEAQVAGFSPMKVNAVVERGANDDEILDLVRYGRDNNVEVRFIEFMPLDATNEWERNKVVSQDEIVATIAAEFPLELMPARGAAPADRWRFLDGKGTVGVIPSVTHPFCGDCDRVRLTSDGQFRTCLFATDESDIRALLRNGGTDDEIAELIQVAVGAKWAGHQINQVNFIRPNRSMSQIGG
ncbi:MAG: GTP 3',8-cyclase MoaA [Actinobacteria bacterium]|jgi:cyclic pyranopterin phosphate synthase|uniref:GTP 3',8-cyclase n=1 Tax=freshwater metagenome TaxID=449393 RepID=A0A6J7T144_9ZZZZ|nr:GTP 3',8-cyclase MoaA [Actinomycetota bacterium]MTB12176.1 GTP 3',8-cyclase MoaA [Actinomycetota bacterium]